MTAQLSSSVLPGWRFTTVSPATSMAVNPVEPTPIQAKPAMMQNRQQFTG